MDPYCNVMARIEVGLPQREDQIVREYIDMEFSKLCLNELSDVSMYPSFRLCIGDEVPNR